MLLRGCRGMARRALGYWESRSDSGFRLSQGRSFLDILRGVWGTASHAPTAIGDPNLEIGKQSAET